MALIKFLTDSAADIPADLARELGIQVLHFPIVMEAGEIQDGWTISRRSFTVCW